MKKFFTLCAAAFAALAVNAQTWDLVTWETAAVTGEVTIEGLTYYGESKSAYAAGSKTFADDATWNGRIKMGGASTFSASALSRVFSFEGKAGQTVKVYAVHGSSSGDDRNVFVSQTRPETKNDVESAFGKLATVAAAESPAVLTATVPADGTVYVWADNNVGIHAIVQEEGQGGGGEGGEAETFVAVTCDASGESPVYTANQVFVDAKIDAGASTVDISTKSVKAIAVGGTTPKDVYQEAGTEFAGWTEWNDVKWDVKNQGDITFGYILGTGNPGRKIEAEEVLDEGARTGHYRALYTYYVPDGGELPVQGLYYQFTPAADGVMAVNVWSNKGNRKTYVVDCETTQPIDYTVEGYINGQNDESGQKKWLTAEDIQAIHDASGNASNPYIIGAGNQPFWGTLTFSVKAGKSYMLFQDSSQIGFQSYTFTGGAAGIEAVNNDVVRSSEIFNLRGERVQNMQNGLYIQNGRIIMIR